MLTQDLDPTTGIALVVDIETASACPIKNGAWRYSEDSSTIVYCVVFGWSFPVNPKNPNVVREFFYEWTPEKELPDAIKGFILGGGSVVAHNVSFERSIWTNILGPKYGWPVPDMDQWRDTQALGAVLNFPPSLAGLAQTIGSEVQKDAEGSKLMKRMAQPIAGDAVNGWEYDRDPDNLKRLVQYCRQDVAATMACWHCLAAMPLNVELEWRTDQKINHRGVYLDVEYAGKIQKMAEDRAEILRSEIVDSTFGELKNATSTPALKKWLKSVGVTLPKVVRVGKKGRTSSETLDAGAVANILKSADVPPLVRSVLENREEANKATSLAKVKRVPDMVGTDGRLRNALQFCGTSTGRWASYGLQVHNLPKNKLKGLAEVVDACIQAGDVEALAMVHPKPLEALSHSLRRVIYSPPGHELIAADYSAIEARVLAWACGDETLLGLFRNGEDVYMHAAALVGTDRRDVGKVCQLALGYGMGVLKLQATAANQGIALDLKETYRMHRAWREGNAVVCSFWYELENAVRDAIETGTASVVGRLRVACSSPDADRGSRVLVVMLPSGRSIYYWGPHIVPATKTIQTVNENGEIESREMKTQEIRYLTVGKDKGSMRPESTYSGKLVENACQAIARDVLAYALTRLELDGRYPPVVHVHDSIVSEVPEGTGDVDEFCGIITQLAPWADGLPLAAEGYRAKRFNG